MGPRPSPPADPAALAEHAAAIRRLARSLVADDAAADDVAQESLRVGLEHPPRAGFPPFAWLAGIARNVARGLRRSDRRRRAREAAAAHPDRVPSTADAVARLAERRRVVDAVLALDEPYRSVIAMRWFDGLPPREIARRQGVPVETARTRGKRGLELLRAELRRRHGGDRRASRAALLPLAYGGGAGLASALVASLGGLLLTPSSKLAVASIVALLLVGGTWITLEATRGPTDDGPAVAPAAPTSPDAPTTLAAHPRARTPTAAPTTLAAADARAVSGRVLGPGNAPLAARIHVHPRDAATTTSTAPTTTAAADGTFAVPVGDATEMRVAATADGFAPAATTARAGFPITLRLRRERALSLRIVDDATRAPIAGAEVESVEVTDGFEHVARATSDAEGHVDVRDPAGPFPDPFAPPRLRVRATGYRTFTFTDAGSAPPRSTPRGRRVDVGLTRGPRVEVRVVRPDGTTPAAGATARGYAGTGAPVAVGSVWRVLPHAFTALGEATAAADGTASLDAAEPDAPLWLVAETPGFRAVRHVRARPDASGPVELVLRPTLTITGRVVDERGRPVAGAEVQAEWRQELASRQAPADDPHFAFPPATLIDRWRHFTGADGAFVVEGSWAPDGSGDVALWAAAAGFGFAKARVTRPPAGPVAPVTLVLAARTGVVTVRVRDREARPVVGAIVGRPRSFPQVVTDADGLATGDPTYFPADERKAVRVVAAGFARAWASLDDAPEGGVLDVVLDRARGLDVRVVDVDGKPVVAELVVGTATVDASTTPTFTSWEDDPRWVGRGWTDEEGATRVEGLPPGPVTLVVREARVADHQVRVGVAADAADVEVRLPSKREDPDALGAVEGEVVDGEGKPFARWSLTLSNDQRSYAPVERGSRFRFDGVLPGAYRLQGWATGAPVPIVRRLTVAAGQEVKGLRLTPPRPATLKGVLRGEGLREGGRVQVVAVAAEVGDAGGRDDGVGADGRFELSNLAPGAYRLLVRTIAPTGAERPLRVADGEFTLEEGVTLERSFDVVPAARLWLRCDDERFAAGPEEMNRDPAKGPGSPRYEASRWSAVAVRDEAGRDVAFRWLFRGRHAVDVGLAPGRYRVTVDAQKLGRFDGDVEVPLTGDVELEVRLAPLPAR